MREYGTLYVVATPIGHLGDWTFRAAQVVKSADIVAAEDTRHSAVLLKQYAIPTTRCVAFHEHNERQQTPWLVAQLKSGRSVALISDAGTPLVSDPGYRLVTAAAEAGILISPIPGPCAAIAALSVSGLPSDRFSFEGFLPARAGKRRTRLELLATDVRTLIFYEAPHRLLETLRTLETTFGSTRRAVVARELTKTFETVYRMTLTELVRWFEEHPGEQRGECVIVVEGAAERAEGEAERREQVHRLLDELLPVLPTSQAVTIVARLTGRRKREIYTWAEARKRRGT